MVKRREGLRLRRGLILALFLLIPMLLADLPLFSKTGHKQAASAPAATSGGANPQALVPADAPVFGARRRHWRISSASGGRDLDDDARDELLRDLVYLTHGDGTGDGNMVLHDGGPDFGGVGQGGTGTDGGAPFPPAGDPGYDPGTDFLPLAFTPDNGKGGPGDDTGGSNVPSFLSPTVPSIAAVPEPATWALFILGFGFIGTALRRARDAGLQPALTRARGKRLG